MADGEQTAMDGAVTSDLAEPGVKTKGFILIDTKSGMCLDVRGAAEKDDASRLYTIARDTIGESANGVVEYRDMRILLRRERNCLVGIYTDLPASEA
ncbi:uncharacterized protein V1510DRAFT_422917 [Dipodascopsis tothii]|uniref:uncharacterized protein n=1 Tax=Dipodascopsis tothii TaxID=44089 RepID=UPI0034CD3CD4